MVKNIASKVICLLQFMVKVVVFLFSFISKSAEEGLLARLIGSVTYGVTIGNVTHSSTHW